MLLFAKQIDLNVSVVLYIKASSGLENLNIYIYIYSKLSKNIVYSCSV